MRYSAIIWDLDGTLLDTLEDLTDATNVALRRFGMPERTRGEVRRFLGNGPRRLISRAVPDGTSDGETISVYNAFLEYYAGHLSSKTAPYPGIPALLSRLAGAGAGMAIVSNKPHFAAESLRQLYFGDYIGISIGFRDGIRQKPAPDAVLAALAALGAMPGQSLLVGDSDVDILTAKAVGMDCLAVSWGFRSRTELLAAGAAEIADSVADAERFLFGDGAAG